MHLTNQDYENPLNAKKSDGEEGEEKSLSVITSFSVKKKKKKNPMNEVVASIVFFMRK